MATEVYATIDGIMKHRHGGAKGWHSAHIAHADKALHARERASQPKYRAGTTEEEKKRYAEALKGKSFEYLWDEGREARRAARVAAGGREWLHHGRKPEEAEEQFLTNEDIAAALDSLA